MVEAFSHSACLWMWQVSQVLIGRISGCCEVDNLSSHPAELPRRFGTLSLTHDLLNFSISWSRINMAVGILNIHCAVCWTDEVWNSKLTGIISICGNVVFSNKKHQIMWFRAGVVVSTLQKVCVPPVDRRGSVFWLVHCVWVVGKRNACEFVC